MPIKLRLLPRSLPKSLRGHLTVVVMVPLVVLVTIFATITCWMIDSSMNDTSDRILVGSTRLISRAVNYDPVLQDRLLPLAVGLLQRRSAPVTHYSIYDGDRLIAGRADLRPPSDYSADGRLTGPLHPGARFTLTSRDPVLVRGYVDPRDAQGVVQPAYLRNGMLNGRPVRIATEMRRLTGNGHLVAVQVADFLENREISTRVYFQRVVSASVLVTLIALLLFYSALAWGLIPFATLTERIAASVRDPLHFQRLPDGDGPREAQMIARAYNALMVRAERAVGSLRQFTSNASHQLRTPLAVLRVHLDVLETYGAQSPQGQMALDDIAHSVDTLERLLQQLLALARLDEQVECSTGQFDPALVATDVIAARLPALQRADVDISFEESGHGLASGEAALAAEMVGNLLDNAVAYNRPGGKVVVRVLCRGGAVRVEIEDDGPGIPPAEREKVWERFYRMAANANSTGSGLGLPIVRALADRMGAKVALDEGAEGRGTRAVIHFRPADREEMLIPPSPTAHQATL
ncbi:two-component system sensor histidine kinase TctE [Novosphingobium sp. SG707]|nr:two-component system sensor histidine kinase TctE [Novosphingobium sp. SG707]